MGRLTVIIGAALAVIVAVGLILVLTLGGGQRPTSPASTEGPRTDPTQIAEPTPLNTTRPTATLAPTTGPSLQPAGQRYSAAQLIQVEKAAAAAYLQYCAYQRGESATAHLNRMRPYFTRGTYWTTAAALSKTTASATCVTVQNRIAGLDAKNNPVVNLVVRSSAKLTDGKNSNRTLTAYLTVVRQGANWYVQDIEQSSVASR